MASHKDILQLIYERPYENILGPRGLYGNVRFDIPEKNVPTNYKESHIDIKKIQTTGIKLIALKSDIKVPDLTIPEKLSRRANFSIFDPTHARMASRLIDIFMEQPSFEDLFSTIVHCHSRINPYLFNYSLTVALLNRKDTRKDAIPSFIQSFPGKFIGGEVMSVAREASLLLKHPRDPIIIDRELTANSKEPEQAVAYFREDIGVNLHHWHWHVVYPFSSNETNKQIVAKDRRGELFYYMHQQIEARYNAERFANDLGYVKPLDNLRHPIKEGYFPKLDISNTGRKLPPRFVNTRLSDYHGTAGNKILLEDLEFWKKEIIEAIRMGFMIDEKGEKIPLTEQNGIDILGNAIESSILTPNSILYGSLHNKGHMLIGSCHDPDNRFLEGFAVMGDPATAMRDPVFYRWHSFINDLFLLHKNSLPRYSVGQLEYQNVTVTDVKVLCNEEINQINTFWEQSDVDISRGLDFTLHDGPVLVRFTHLQHEPFNYDITVNNSSASQIAGTVRIFMAPKVDEHNILLNFDEQRTLMIELDRFKVELKSGENKIVRKSSESSVTIPYERTFHDLNNTADDSNIFHFCDCGWPDHMLIPRGTVNGMGFDLFVMVSNFQNDFVTKNNNEETCSDAFSYCGIRDQKYPDKQPMGFPFDRVSRDGVTKLSDFLTPNMKVQQIVVKHKNRTVHHSRKSLAGEIISDVLDTPMPYFTISSFV